MPDNQISLYRAEAAAAFKHRLSGEPVARMPIGWIWLAALLIVILAAAAIFVITNDYARKERAVGVVLYVKGEKPLRTTANAIITDLRVKEGDTVRTGDPLLVLKADQVSADGAVLSEAVEQSVRRELAVLNARKGHLVAAGKTQKQALMLQIMESERERAAIDHQADSVARRLKIMREQVASTEKLADAGALTKRELERRRVQLLADEERFHALAQSRASLSSRAIGQQAQYDSLDNSTALELSAIDQSIARLERDLADIAARKGLLIRATSSGRIAALKGAEGSSIRAGDRILTIVADDSPLEAELFLPPKAMARIAPGAPVRLFYTAFPHQRYGVQHGAIRQISDTVYQPDELPLGLQLKEAAYRARVRLDTQQIKAFGATHALRSGMTLTAEVIIEDQTLFEWLLEPLQRR